VLHTHRHPPEASIHPKPGGLLVLDRELHTIAFTYFTGDSYLGGYGQAIAKSLAAMDAAIPYGQQVARLLTDLKGDAREVDAHVRL